MHGNLYIWIISFFTDRLIQIKISNAFSSKVVLKEGHQQGRILSYNIFLLFINDLPACLKSEKALYADCLTFWQTEKEAHTCAILL